MSQLHNPYAKALDGLLLDDPVSAFFEFCRERERIRIKRESGAPPPWTEDPIFKRGRFLNVFREDDRGSKAIINFVNDLKNDPPSLIHALFFARWCNRQETLDQLTVNDLANNEELRKKLNLLKPWSNLSAYPVETVTWNGSEYSRLDAATILFGKIKDSLFDLINKADGSVIEATRKISNRFNMQNNFPIFMAVIDIAWFRPDIINPESDVPTGIGAVAYLDRLQNYLGLENHQQTCKKMIELQKDIWPAAKRQFYPIDVEYLSCECRKYYSYVNETKHFEGKNIFQPFNKSKK
tara:strand:+ start:97 stop:981 length:885 start_codon:yes stop_codon:yes gene_type:complete